MDSMRCKQQTPNNGLKCVIGKSRLACRIQSCMRSFISVQDTYRCHEVRNWYEKYDLFLQVCKVETSIVSVDASRFGADLQLTDHQNSHFPLTKQPAAAAFKASYCNVLSSLPLHLLEFRLSCPKLAAAISNFM